jgi:adenosylhomocysteine nucleosidase
LTRIGVIAALPAEARALSGRTLQPGQVHEIWPGILVYPSGIGASAAERAGEKLLHAGCEALLSWGTAAALDPALRPGTIVLPAQATSAGGDRLACDTSWRSRLETALIRAGLEPAGGVVAEATRILESPAHKQALADITGAVIADMESTTIGDLALRRRIPWLAVRAVADAAGSTVPAPLCASLDEYGRPGLPTLLAALLRDPRLLREAWRLRSDFRAALHSLRRVARIAAPAFAYH